MMVQVSVAEGWERRMKDGAPPPFDLDEARTYLGLLIPAYLDMLADVEILLESHDRDAIAAAQRRLAQRLDKAGAT